MAGDLLDRPQAFNGQQVLVNGYYLSRAGASVLANAISTLDNGRDAQPIGVRLAHVTDLAREHVAHAFAMFPVLH